MGRQIAKGLKIAALGVAAGIAASVKAAIDFDKEMRNVNSIAQLSERRFGNLREKVLALAGPTAQAPKTLAAGLYDLVSSGFNSSESLQILSKSARAATAGLTTTEVSTKAVAAVLNAYHLAAGKAGDTSDVLFQIVNRGVITFEELAQNIGDVLPFGSSLGVNLREVGASIATMTKAGISAPETMTRIKAVMVTMLKPGKDLAKVIDEQGFASGDAMVKALGFQGTLDALAQATGGSKTALAALFPNVRALGGALALTGENSKGAAEDLKGMQDAAGATTRALSQQEKSISFQWNQLKANAEVLAINFGTKLLPALSEVMAIISDPKLTVDQKVGKVFDLISEGAQKALDEATRLATAYGPRIIGALASGMASAWWHANPLGKLLGVAALIRVLGGKGAITATGAAIGRELGFGISTGVAETVVLNEVGAGVAGSTAAGLGAASGARWLGTDAAPKTAAEIGGFGEKAALRDVGLVGGGAATSRLGGLLRGGGIEALGGLGAIGIAAGTAGGYFAAEFGAKAIEGITGNDLLENQNLAESLTHGFNTDNVASTERGALNRFQGIHPSLDPEAVAKLKMQFKSAMADLSVDAIQGIGNVNADLRRGLAITDGTWSTGTKQWRAHTILAMQDAVKAIKIGMQDGVISAKQGHDEINELLRKIHLIGGDDPIGLAKGLAGSFKQAGGLTTEWLHTFTSDMEDMPKAQREAAENGTIGMLRAWAQGHPKIERQIADLTAYEIHHFGATNQQLREGVRQNATGPVAQAFQELASGVGGALQNIGTNTSQLLRALGMKSIGEFKVTQIGNGKEFTNHQETKKALHHQHRATGGFIVPGRGDGDTFKTALPPGSFILNKKATEAFGLQRGGHTPVMLEPGERVFMPTEAQSIGQRALESANTAVPRFATGGALGHPQISGGLPGLRGLGQKAIDDTWGVASKVIAAARAEHNDSLGGMAASGSVGSHPELQPGISAIVATILKRWPALGITSTTGGVHATNSLHPEGRAADLAAGSGYMLKAAAWIKENLGASLTEGIHNPNLSIKYGKEVGPGFWGSDVWADHLDHIHVGKQLGGLIQALSSGGSVPPSSGELVGASYYGGPTDHVSGTVGAAGVSLPGKMSFAELAMGKALGGLPFHTKLKIGYNGKSVIAEKLDIGLGGDDVAGHNRAIDLWYETANAIGMPGTGVVKVSPASGSVAGLTAGQKQAKEGKARKANYEHRLHALMGEVNEAQTAPAKQSKLWKLIKFWGRVGIFDQGEHAHIIEAVQNAAAQTKPQGAVDILQSLAGYAKDHGEITGQDPSNFRDMMKAIERAQDRGKKQREKAVERQKKHIEAIHGRVAGKIANRAAFPGLVANLANMRHGADVQEEYASQLFTLEPEDLSDAYVGQERGAYQGELDRLLGWRNSVVGARGFATQEIARFQQQLAEIEAMAPQANVKGSQKGQGLGSAQVVAQKASYDKVAYKIPLLKKAVADATTMRDETWAGELEELQGLNGPSGILASLSPDPVAGAIGGRIFETQNAIRELGLKVGSATGGGDSETASMLQELLRQANQRTAVSEAQKVTLENWDSTRKGFAGMFATGGSIPAGMWGIAGENGPEPVAGPGTVFSNREGQEMFGGGGGSFTFVVNGDIVQEKGDPRDPIEVLEDDRRFPGLVQKHVRAGRGTGQRTPGSHPRR